MTKVLASRAGMLGGKLALVIGEKIVKKDPSIQVMTELGQEHFKRPSKLYL